MVSQKIQAQFDAIVARRDELKGKSKLSKPERIELAGLEETLEIAPTAEAMEQVAKDLEPAERDIAEGNVITLRTPEDFQAFRRRIKE